MIQKQPLNSFSLKKRSFRLSTKILSVTILAGFTTQGFQPELLAANQSAPMVPGTTSISPDWLQQGKAFYDGGRFLQAVQVLQQAAEVFKNQGDKAQQAIALSNLSLAYQQLGQWAEAQNAIATSLQLLQSESINLETGDRLKLLAQALDIQGRWQFIQGQAEPALVTWQQAAATYAQAGDGMGVTRAQINQAQAQQAQGLYRRALETLKQVQSDLQNQPDSTVKATGFRSLGNALRLIGDLDQSEKVLQQSLTIAEKLSSPQDTSSALLSLGNNARAKQNNKGAIAYYQQAAAAANYPLTKIQAQLNQLSLLAEGKQPSTALNLWQEIQGQLSALPPSRAAVDARINLAKSLMKLSANNSSQTPALPEIAQILAVAIQQAQSLGDPRAQSYALGQLGGLYEMTQQRGSAIQLTQQALVLAQSINAPDIAYRWQWQLGRLLKGEGKTEEAIAAYNEAVNNLQALRNDLASVNPDVQFSFRESVEPVYRQLVGLLLESKTAETSQKNLSKAREVIESLQLAELVNFFRAACLNAKEVKIDQVDIKAAVIYPIILEDRLEIILSVPDAPLRHYTTYLSQTEVDKTADQLRQALVTRTSKRFLPLSQKVYDWLIRPAEADLTKNQIKTLVFVLDGSLRNLPMSTLHDGKQFLLEKYAIALTPGLQLLESQPLTRGNLSALTAGLTEARGGFNSLPSVGVELQKINAQVTGELLLNESFTDTAIQKAIQSSAFPVIHLATHGQFSSKAEETFILTWDDRINVNQLNNLLQSREQRRPIELLILSACQTAVGDKRAALGLAGVAVRAGARSTLATLWYVDDAATAPLMVEFYQQLSNASVTKAEALRRAQLSIMKERRYQHPLYWAPYVLVGNWL
jgi:CHAT domain-containing protein